MAKLVGIDFRSRCVRACVLRTSYRRVFVEALVEVEVASFENLEEAIRVCAEGLASHSESIACSFSGEASFIHRLTLPTTAARRLAEILPFELEAQMPVDFQDLIYDYRQLGSSSKGVTVLAAAARIDDVQDRIALVQAALGREPERVSVAGIPLANLVPFSPALSVSDPVALVDVGDRRSELLILEKGQPQLARTISVGIEGLPDSAVQLASALRQSITAWAVSGGNPISVVYLCGTGADVQGAEEYLSQELGISVRRLPEPSFAGVSETDALRLVRFAKAIGLALSLRSGARDLSLRRGELAYQRGYGFLKEKIPLLAGLTTAVFLSFLFSAWAEQRALSQEHAALDAKLGALSKQIFDEETADPERVTQLLEDFTGQKEKDPQPEVDAFDLMAKFLESVPEDITHDVDEFEVQRGHVKIQGVVNTSDDAERVASALKVVPCYEGAKISKLTQKVNSESQKYMLEFDLRCEDDKSKQKKLAAEKEGE